MLVRFTAVRAWRIGAVTVWLPAASCSLVVGELPEPLPGSGPTAGGGAAGQGSGGSSAQAAGEPPVGEAGDRAVTGGVSAGGSGTAGGSVAGAGAAGSATSCDADHDEHLAPGKCGGDDCDDSDADVSPDQSDYFDQSQPRVGYDYDCSGAPEREQSQPIVCTGLTVVECPTGQPGFLGTLPACGEVGNWGQCVKGSALEPCVEDVVATPRMRCH
jgi:hypothetical protein